MHNACVRSMHYRWPTRLPTLTWLCLQVRASASQHFSGRHQTGSSNFQYQKMRISLKAKPTLKQDFWQPFSL